MDTVLSVRRLGKTYRSRAGARPVPALDGVSFSVAGGEFVCLLGPSGCGKSTVLNILAGLDRAFTGEAGLGPGVRIGVVFQSPRLLPWLTVRQNLLFALETSAVPRAEWEVRADDWLQRVGLGPFAHVHPHELSGGMQHRAAVARAFAVDPDLLLMDEPFTGLDEFTARAMRRELLQLWRETRRSVLFVTHNCFEACYLADRILVMSAGPGRIRDEIVVDLPRPRDDESPELFERSVAVTRTVLAAASPRAV
ncbi:MAG TPA: ABC transporter ATP-binding protein [Candidatus Dormibacteraeota bacterium]|nr:ABC transporter ATP-binding protein [Candidatus Dormibacteraeota bacterium]